MMLQEPLKRTLLHMGCALSKELLNEGCSLAVEDEDSQDDAVFTGVPKKPFYLQLAKEMETWGRGTQKEFGEIDLLQDDEGVKREVETKLETHQSEIEEIVRMVETGESDSVIPRMQGVLEGIGQLGVLRLMGLRLTIGTATAVGEHGLWPPSYQELLESFNTLLCDAKGETCSGVALKSKLTVGGKALAKHAVRHESWWGGELKGTEVQKSLLAEAKAISMINSATWMNLHMLPHGKPTFEIRVPAGYGARWVFEGDSLDFRGFLEPQQKDGHENKWRH